MMKFSNTMSSYKSLLIYYLVLLNTIYFVDAANIYRDVESKENSASIDREAENEENSDSSEMAEDMRVIENDELPDVSRKALMKIIQKSQFFQDIFSEQPDPKVIQFGHVCENPNEWEQRYEQQDFNKNQFKGKMRWGNKNGDYGEHYWDLGHAG